jgi:redox-sensitive bicupin YhaK (pirin superfamily)
MIAIRRAEDRGHANHGWLDTHFTFSFADYYDPRHMGYRSLRVINDDVVKAGRGFGMHPHRDMEIVTYVLDGALEHKDSMGNGSIIRPGDVQRMTAGTGVFHSEFNPSATEPVHLLQIWILPEARGLTPGYEQTAFSDDEKRGRFRLIASRDGRDGSVTIHQDASIYASIVEPGQTVEHRIEPGRHAWLHVARGSVQFDGRELKAGDGVALAGEPSVSLTGETPAEVLLFDLA